MAAAVARATDLVGAHVIDLHRVQALSVVLDGGGAALTTGTKCDLAIPWSFTIAGWALYANAAGVLEIDLQTSASYTAYPDDLVSICAAAKPALVDDLKATDSTLTGWTTALPGGGVLRVVVESAAEAITLATLTLRLRAV